MPTPVLRLQRQLRQRPHRAVGAQHRVGQLEQRIGSGGQTPVELFPEPGKITQPGIGPVLAFDHVLRHTARHGHRLRLRALWKEPEDDQAVAVPCPVNTPKGIRIRQEHGGGRLNNKLRGRRPVHHLGSRGPLRRGARHSDRRIRNRRTRRLHNSGEPGFARLQVTDPTTGTTGKVELGIDWRAHQPVTLAIGPVLHPDDAVANKICALFARAQARDYIDVDAVLRSGRYTSGELLTLAESHDPGLTRQGS